MKLTVLKENQVMLSPMQLLTADVWKWLRRRSGNGGKREGTAGFLSKIKGGDEVTFSMLTHDIPVGTKTFIGLICHI